MKVKQLSMLLIGVTAISITACNNGSGSSNSGSKTVSANTVAQSDPLAQYKYTIYNLTSEDITKLVISDATYKPLKTIDNFKCTVGAACGLNDPAVATSASLQFYNKAGKLLSATPVRADATRFYADDSHFGTYLLKFALHNKDNLPIPFESIGFNQFQALGNAYRSANNAGQTSDHLINQLLVASYHKSQPVLMAQSNLGGFGKGNSACMLASKVLAPSGELSSTVSKAFVAFGSTSPWFDVFGGVLKAAGGFTGAGCDIASQVTSMLKQMDAKLDTVITAQQQTLDAISKLDSTITSREVLKHLNSDDQQFKKLAQYNTLWVNLMSPQAAVSKIGRPIESLNDYIEYKGGIDKALQDEQFTTFLSTHLPALLSKLEIATNTDPMSSDLALLWRDDDALCKPNADGNIKGGNMPEFLALCDYSASKILQTYVPTVIQTEQLLVGLNASLDDLKAQDNATYEKIYNKLGVKLSDQVITDIKDKWTIPFVNMATSRYENQDNFYTSINNGQQTPNWLNFLRNIHEKGLLYGGATGWGIVPSETNPMKQLYCEVSSMESSEVAAKGVSATVNCYQYNWHPQESETEKGAFVWSDDMTNIAKSYGHYDYALSWLDWHPGFAPDLPGGDWTASCDVATAQLIGENDWHYGGKMTFKARCDDGHGKKVWSYLDLRTRSPWSKNNNFSGPVWRNATNYKLQNIHGHLEEYSNRDLTEKEVGLPIPSGNYLKYCSPEMLEISSRVVTSGDRYARLIVACQLVSLNGSNIYPTIEFKSLYYTLRTENSNGRGDMPFRYLTNAVCDPIIPVYRYVAPGIKIDIGPTLAADDRCSGSDAVSPAVFKYEEQSYFPVSTRAFAHLKRSYWDYYGFRNTTKYSGDNRLGGTDHFNDNFIPSDQYLPFWAELENYKY